jgi:hypothetical protein
MRQENKNFYKKIEMIYNKIEHIIMTYNNTLYIIMENIEKPKKTNNPWMMMTEKMCACLSSGTVKKFIFVLDYLFYFVKEIFVSTICCTP